MFHTIYMFYFSAAMLAKIILHEVQKKLQSVEKLILIVYLPDESTYKPTKWRKQEVIHSFSKTRKHGNLPVKVSSVRFWDTTGK